MVSLSKDILLAKLLKKVAGGVFFSDWIDDEERRIVEDGFRYFKDEFVKKYKQKAISEFDSGNVKLYRLIVETNMYLKGVGDPRKLVPLESWTKYWRDAGEDKIADALQVRVDEAKYDEPEVTTEETEEEAADTLREGEYQLLENEEAPETVRSLVAKTLQFASAFAKMARG